ncbi:MAG: RibD family protein [Spirochaetales bacterium]|nr:RibD family protein [Spirochaetales bacterium]
MKKADYPYVTVSYAQSLDGRIATSEGDSQWIGGPESLRLAHELRRDHDGILVGVGTVLRDDPLLTCRIPDGRNPIRIILDSTLRTPVSSRILSTTDQSPVWLLHGSSASPERREILAGTGCRFFELNSGEGQGVDRILSLLKKNGVKSLFVEGGGATITSFLTARAVDCLTVITAPLLIGKGIEAVGELGIRVLAKAMRPLRFKRWTLGNDEVTQLFFTERTLT